MLDTTTKQKIDSLRNLLVGKVPDPKSQVEQITVALFYKFMWDRDKEIKDLGGNATFFIGEFEKYSWENLFAPDLGGSECIKLYSEAIEEMENNPNIPSIFRDIFKRAFLPYNDPYTLRLFLKEINDFHYSNSEKLGDGFEYLLSILGTQGDAGQFRTPRHIIDFITEIVNPQKGDRICDPACGTAGFIISAYKHILKTNTKESLGDLLTPEDKKRVGNNLVGLDIDPMMVKLALANMYLHGLNEPHIYEYDSLTSEERWDDIYDVVLANPPFMTPSGGIRPHKRFAVNATKAEVLFTSYINTHLSNNGRAGIVVPEGIIFQSGKAYKELRKQLIDSSLIGVVSLPGGVFNPYSGVKTSILILDKAFNKKTDKIFFAKVENDGFDLGSQRREIDENDLPRISKAINKYCDQLNDDDSILKYVSKQVNDDDSILKYVSKQEILDSNDLGLTYERYNSKSEILTDFDTVRIGDVGNFINGHNFKKTDWTSSGKKIIRIQNLNDNTKPFNLTEKVVDEKYTIKNGELLISWSASIGFYIWNGGDSLLNQHIFKADLNEKINKKYFYFLGQKITNIIKSQVHGNTMQHITRGRFEDIKIPLPPHEIQKEIVEELEQYQKVIDGAKQIVDNYKPHFEIDESWKEYKIGEICEFRYGKGLKQTERSGDGYDVYGSNGSVGKHNKYLIEGPFIIIGRKGSAGACNYSEDRGWPIDTTFYINQDSLKQTVNLKFLYFYLSNIGLEKISSEQTVPGLNRNDAYSKIIKLPSLDVQNNIVEKLEYEKRIVDGNKKLIEIYSKKISDRINKIWGE